MRLGSMTTRQWEDYSARAAEIGQEDRVVPVGVCGPGQLLKNLHPIHHLPRASGILVEEIRERLDGGRASLCRLVGDLGFHDGVVGLHVRNLYPDQSQRD